MSTFDLPIITDDQEALDKLRVEGKLAWSGDDDLSVVRALGRRLPPNEVHAAADAFEAKMLVALEYAFAAARKSVDKVALLSALKLESRIAKRRAVLAALRPAPEALKAALGRTVPPVLERCYGAGGAAGVIRLGAVGRALGGPGSGNFGHAGRPGEVGGSSSSWSEGETIPKIDGFYIPPTSKESQILFHGTASANLESIRRNGLIPKGNAGADAGLLSTGYKERVQSFQIGDRDGSVFMAMDSKSAQNYARWALRVHPGSQAILLAIKVPSDVVGRGDEFDSQALRFNRSIPPEWIRVLNSDGSLKALKDGDVTVYAVVLCTSTDEEKLRSLRRDDSLVLKMKFDAKNEAAKKWARKHSGELVRQITKTTRQRIASAVVNALDGGSPRELYKSILKVIGDKDRADLIAKTELMDAANSGQREAWAQAVEEGLLTGLEMREWIATDDPSLCDHCDRLDGQLAELDGDYPDGGGIGPPLHPRCRCTEGISARRRTSHD